jgi:predicted nucleic acid-binding protein
MVFVDTDVLVECLRGSAAAKNWLETFPKEAFAIPGAVAMELVISPGLPDSIRTFRPFPG